MQRTNSTERRKRSITAESLRKNRGTRLSLLRPLPLIAFCPRRNTHSFDRNWDPPPPIWERRFIFQNRQTAALCFVLARSRQCDDGQVEFSSRYLLFGGKFLYLLWMEIIRRSETSTNFEKYRSYVARLQNTRCGLLKGTMYLNSLILQCMSNSVLSVF